MRVLMGNGISTVLMIILALFESWDPISFF